MRKGSKSPVKSNKFHTPKTSTHLPHQAASNPSRGAPNPSDFLSVQEQAASRVKRITAWSGLATVFLVALFFVMKTLNDQSARLAALEAQWKTQQILSENAQYGMAAYDLENRLSAVENRLADPVFAHPRHDAEDNTPAVPSSAIPSATSSQTTAGDSP